MAQAERTRSADLKPGTKLRWRDGGTVVLARRKVEAEHRHAGLPFHPGWWLEDNRGGLADSTIDRDDSEWTVVEAAGAGHVEDVPLTASEPNRPKTGR